MSGRGLRVGAARLLCTAGCLPLFVSHAFAQTASAQQTPPPATEPELDPNAPLAPLPGLGVEWPDLNAKDTTPPSQTATEPQQQAKPAEKQTEANGTLRYTIEVEGLTIGGAEDLLKSFRQQ